MIILWADDEIELLKPHIMYLEQRGYEVVPVVSGQEAIDYIRTSDSLPDIIFLDEMMPGLTGLDTLTRIKALHSEIPVVMITKSEEEQLMEQAIGQQIADYLIKPVLPSQMLLCIKKHLQGRELQREQQQSDYMQEFRMLSQVIDTAREWDDWCDLYKRLTYWELMLSQTLSESALEMLESQRKEADKAFSKFIIRNYPEWASDITQNGINAKTDRPLMSPDIIKTDVLPRLDNGEKVWLVVIDNLPLDQWNVIQPLFAQWFTIQQELYCSILPTSTQYARNAIFSGLMPLQVARMFPDLWVDEDEDEGKNMNEQQLLSTLIDRMRRQYRFSYHKVNENAFAELLVKQFRQHVGNQFNAMVINFVDMLSHARTENKAIRELSGTSAAYRNLTRMWLEHSPVLTLFSMMAEAGYTVVLTTDHGSIQVENPVRIVGDREVNTNIRYKLGKNLNCDSKDVFWIDKPERFGLPAPNVSTRYALCKCDDYFCYPNNYSYYAQYYRHTLQHGGISMQEMIVPLVVMTPR